MSLKKVRLPFYDKYLPYTEILGIPIVKIKTLLKRYTILLQEELLDTTPMKLSPHFRDNRTTEEYIYDLLDGRIMEELICLWFIENGHTAYRAGSDADDKIQRSNPKRITTKADLVVDGKALEIQISRAGKRSSYDIKKSKGDRILKGLNTLMFIVDDKYFLIKKEDIAALFTGSEVQ